jgi:murein DD-endopeptidase MepM/ murein hydrolase activator NlpD
MLKFIGPMREPDKFGSGEYGAPRGTRKHNGVDIAASPGSIVMSPVSGTVSKLGHPYGDDLSFQYVQLTDTFGYLVRLFYVEPQVALGEEIMEGWPVGRVQTLQKRYPGITDHVHLEVMKGGEHLSWFDYLHKRGLG